MAQPTNAFSSYDSVGTREDLTDVIYDISPMETPFFSMIGKSKATQTLHEWQTDALRAADNTNAAIDGDDASGSALTATSRKSNRTHIIQGTVIITGTQESVLKAGRKSEMAYQIARESKALKRDWESIICGNNALVAGNDTTARETGALENWLSTNKSHGTSGVTAGDGGAITDGTQRAFSETLLKDVLESIWTNGGEAEYAIAGPKTKRNFSAFSGLTTQNTENSAGSKSQLTIAAGADVYISDWGVMKVVPSRFNRDRTLSIIQPDMWATAYLRPFRVQPLSKTGDSEKRQIIMEAALEARNEASSGKVADLTV